MSNLIKMFGQELIEDRKCLLNIQFYCNIRGFSFKNNDNIVKSSLNKRKLHLSRGGPSFIANAKCKKIVSYL